MAAHSRSGALESRTARLKLAPRGKPYTVRIGAGIRLGYRRTQTAGTWSVIAADGHGKNWVRQFAVADDYEEADASTVLTFWQAQDQARSLARTGKDGQSDGGRLATVAEGIEAYRLDLQARGGHQLNATRLPTYVPPALARRTVALLTARELRQWRDGLLKRGIKTSSVNRLATCLRACLQLAAATDPRIAERPWRIGLAHIPDAYTSRNVILPEIAVRQIIAAAYDISPEFGLFVEVAAVTGARPSQLARITPDDVQADRADPRLMMPSSMKGRGRRRIERKPIPIPATLAVKLADRGAGKAADAFLLTKPSGEAWRPSDHCAPFRRAVRAAGLSPEVTIYALRHSAIVRQLLANTPIRVVATLHDTSVPMLERTYSKHIADHADGIARRALLDTGVPSTGNVVPLVRER